MSTVSAMVDDQLQFEIRGVVRSYNALYPVAVIADFTATRLPGRFIRNDDEEE